MHLKIRHILLLGITSMLLFGCSTEKAKWANIRYHNTTCHYNVWWNGNESLKAGKQKLFKSAIDDYTAFLPPEKIGTPDDARNIYPEMDRAIEKGVKGIKQHSIYVKGEEHVPYIKECYLLTAYGSFYKQDYVATANTCNILISQFPGTRAGDEGAVLMARCLTREQRYAEAEAALDQLVQRLSKGNFARNQSDKLYLAMVEATLPQSKFKKCVEYIHHTIDATSDRTVKARLTFLMAQIYQRLDKRSVASKYYHEVLKYGPEYVMEFNARLGEASCADMQHTDVARLERQLDAMLSDRKNLEFRDQIYYAKGEMYMGVKDARKACDNYRLSVAHATANRAQKARSSIRLAEVLFDIYEDYDQAQLYYDTAMQCITKDFPAYKLVKQRHDMLTELVYYTRAISHSDSLLAVAALPETELMALIQAKIDTLNRREEEARQRALIEDMKAEAKAMQNTLTGDWYFYNPNTVQKGKETFRQRWGVRVLEDYWFLSHKPLSGQIGLMDDNLADDEETKTDSVDASADTKKNDPNGNPSDPHNVAYYLKDLPRSQRAIDSIDSLTSLCLLNAGYIYYDGIQNTPRALDCYLRLANNYTSHPEIVQAFYMLYRIYDKQGNTPQANYYRDMVLMGFPDSDFANLIRDNEYYKELLRRDRRLEEDYEQLYTLYAQRRYTSVIALADESEEVYGNNPALERFRYWKALALTRRGEKTEALGIFQGIVNRTSTTDSIHPLALAQIERLNSDTSTIAQRDESITDRDISRSPLASRLPTAQPAEDDEEELPEESQVYRYRENQQHYVVVVINDRRLNVTEMQYKIADFNTKYYTNSGYKVDAFMFTDTTQIINIHRFMTADQAMGYYRHLCQQESPLRAYSDTDYTVFAISTQNYATFYNRKRPEAYMPFFQRYYINKKN